MNQQLKLDLGLAFDVAEATKDQEEQMRAVAKRAIDYAKAGDQANAERLLSIMRETNDEIVKRTELIISVYRETEKNIHGE